MLLDQTLRYAIEISDALDKAHRKGITHRDLKPSNIMLTKMGSKLLDFGLAKLRDLPSRDRQGAAPLADARGSEMPTLRVLYEMATGIKAFEGKSQASVISRIMQMDPPPISSLQPMTPRALDRVVKRCLAKDADERWQSANDLMSELKWIAEAGSQGLAAAAGGGIVRRISKIGDRR